MFLSGKETNFPWVWLMVALSTVIVGMLVYLVVIQNVQGKFLISLKERVDQIPLYTQAIPTDEIKSTESQVEDLTTKVQGISWLVDDIYENTKKPGPVDMSKGSNFCLHLEELHASMESLYALDQQRNKDYPNSPSILTTPLPIPDSCK